MQPSTVSCFVVKHKVSAIWSAKWDSFSIFAGWQLISCDLMFMYIENKASGTSVQTEFGNSCGWVSTICLYFSRENIHAMAFMLTEKLFRPLWVHERRVLCIYTNGPIVSASSNFPCLTSKGAAAWQPYPLCPHLCMGVSTTAISTAACLYAGVFAES